MTKHAHSLEMPTWAFVLLAMVGSFLLFLVQPMIAKIALPQLGSSPAVWNSAMVAFQLLLLMGYVYAHGLQRIAIRLQIVAHAALLVLSALWLPISFNASEISTDSSLVLSVPWRIVVAIGPLFLLLAAQAPLLQSWLGRNGSKDGPYQLYVWSNLGSFCGLLAYPLLVDPVFPLALQKSLWAWVYLGFVAAMAVLAVVLTRLEATRSAWIDQYSEGRTQWPRWQQGMKWLVFAAIPSALILSTTTHLTTDIMTLPLLWVLPLALYLLSFVIAFSENSHIASVIVRHARLPLALFGILALSTDAFEVPVTGFASLAFLFIAGLSFHRQLFDERPNREGLTAFYIILSTGGALGGLLVAIIAPLIFNWAYEYPILVVAGIALSQQDTSERNSVLVAVLLAISMGLVVTVFLDWYRPEQIWLASSFTALTLLVHKHKFALPAIATCAVLALSVLDALFLSSYGLHQRSYFGNYTIGENDAGTLRTLTHGTTTHGVQRLASEHAIEPTGYFGWKSGVGQVLNQAPVLFGPNAHIGVVGVGAGTLACYARDGQSWTFYEIDPLVVDIAVRQGWFTYMTNCAPNAQIKLGDARLTLSQQQDQSLDMLVMDAFSSDAVPTHLLTAEAFEIYDSVLAVNGVLLIHISNRYLDLEPVLAREGEARGWSAALLKYEPGANEREQGQRASVWVVMSKSSSLLAQATQGGNWRKLHIIDGFRRWTDDYGSVFSLIKWRGAGG